jgi:transcription termination factor Rho
VSVDSIDLDGLERKDRAELATIAQALGGKPGSRAKKADIISMILELAGVTPGGAASTTGSSSAEPSGDAPHPSDPPHASEGPIRSEDPTAGDALVPGAAERSDTAERSDEAAGSPAAAAPARRRGGRGDSAASSDDASGPASEQPSGRSGSSGQAGSSAASGEGASDGGAQSGDQQPAEGEGGRRRRRRRGRDRDRNEEGGDSQSWEGELIDVAGILDLRDEGYGFLRVDGLLPSRDDVYVSVKQTRQFGLRRGDWVTGASRPANRGEKNPALLRIDSVNGSDPERSRERPAFEDLTPLFPNERLRLEREDHPYDIAGRVIDLLAPIGKGQRGLIVSPPKAGKTTIMKTLAQCIEANHPEVELMVLLVDERPEEVTDMRRSIEGEVVASTFDRPADEHIQVAELAIERAKRMVEQGQDVVVILDGITRLARAYNLAAPNGGRIMSGGLDTAALYPPKRFFGAARNLEEGGSLTILATALVETGSKMDEVIFEEFKGTGNMELRLSRAAAEQRVFPAIDVDGSSTRHDELLVDSAQQQQVLKLRRLLSKLAAEGDPAAGLELVIDRMRKFPTNEVFLAGIAKAPAIS